MDWDLESTESGVDLKEFMFLECSWWEGEGDGDAGWGMGTGTGDILINCLLQP